MPDWARDIILRGVGIGLSILSMFAAYRLYFMVHALPGHQASPEEMGIGAVAFLCASTSAVLVPLGNHIFDDVRISARWAARMDVADAQGGMGSGGTEVQVDFAETGKNRMPKFLP